MHPLNGFFSPMKFFFHILICLLPLGHLLSLPEGTEVLQGGATHSTVGKEMTIRAPDGSILRHKRFNLASDETIRFEQPTTESRALNRITDSAPSRIDGRIEANGRVYIVNPAGVVFGSGSTVEAGRLHVIGGRYSDEDFNARTHRYSDLSGEIRNEGELRAESISLSGSSVTNLGRIHAPDGFVALSAGSSVELLESDGSLSVSLQTGSQNLVTNQSVVGDLAGQALLETGILESREVHLSGSEVDASGSIRATRSRMLIDSHLRQTGEGANVETEMLEIESLSSGTSSQPTIELSSSANRLSTLRASGAYTRFSASSSTSLSVENASTSSESSPSSFFFSSSSLLSKPTTSTFVPTKEI